jgi:hypothetical protein
VSLALAYEGHTMTGFFTPEVAHDLANALYAAAGHLHPGLDFTGAERGASMDLSGVLEGSRLGQAGEGS